MAIGYGYWLWLLAMAIGYGYWLWLLAAAALMKYCIGRNSDLAIAVAKAIISDTDSYHKIRTLTQILVI